jgi:hypothetical protein
MPGASAERKYITTPFCCSTRTLQDPEHSDPLFATPPISPHYEVQAPSSYRHPTRRAALPPGPPRNPPLSAHRFPTAVVLALGSRPDWPRDNIDGLRRDIVREHRLRLARRCWNPSLRLRAGGSSPSRPGLSFRPGNDSFRRCDVALSCQLDCAVVRGSLLGIPCAVQLVEMLR